MIKTVYKFWLCREECMTSCNVERKTDFTRIQNSKLMNTLPLITMDMKGFDYDGRGAILSFFRLFHHHYDVNSPLLLFSTQTII